MTSNEISPTVAAVLERGVLTVDDELRFATHVEVLQLFGKHLRGHMRAEHGLDDDWVVWFPKLYRNGDWDNALSPDGAVLGMTHVREGRYDQHVIYPEADPRGRIIFAHVRGRSRKRSYRFVGVFTALQGPSQAAQCSLISTTLLVDGEGGFSVAK